LVNLCRRNGQRARKHPPFSFSLFVFFGPHVWNLINSSQLLIFDPSYDPRTSPQADRSRPRRLSTDLRGIVGHTVLDLVHWGINGPNTRHIRIDPQQIWIYAGSNRIDDVNRSANINLSTTRAGTSRAPPCIEWLSMVAEAYQYDPLEWLECSLATTASPSHEGMVPVAFPSGHGQQTYTQSAGDMEDAGWEQIRE